MPFQLHPFDPALNKPRQNADGSISTEITRTVQLSDGKWVNVPSLWYGDSGSPRDFGSMSDDQLGEFATRYERESGRAFPRFPDLPKAESAARARSNAGGGTQGTITGAKPMPNFNQMGAMPEGYGSLLNDARQNLVRMPDGTFAPAPNRGQAYSLNDIYGGILPPSVPSPRSPIGAGPGNYGTMVGFANDPIYQGGQGFSPDTMTATQSEQSGSRPALTQGTQPAGMMTLPPGVRPASIDRAFAQMGNQPGMLGRGMPPAPPPMQTAAADPFGTIIPNQNQSRLPTGIPNPEDAGFLATYFPEQQNPALGAIDVTVNGGNQMPPMPRIRPLPPAQIPLTSLMPSQQGSRGVPQIPGPYTIKKGDTLGELAKKFGTTVGQLANANNISNPNKIRAGSTLNLGFMAPPVPRTPSPAQRTPPQYSNRERQIAEGRASQLDEFGNIR